MTYSAVMPRVATVRTIADIAEQQWGLVTRRQVEGSGIAWTTLARLASDGVLERVTWGVYRLRGSPPPDHLALRGAWLQLAPDSVAPQRKVDQGVVSHRSAAAVWGLGQAPQCYEFTLRARRQTRRPDVRLHRASLNARDCMDIGGLLVTRPARIAADLLGDGEEPDLVAPIVTASVWRRNDDPATIAGALAPLSARFGLPRNDGVAMLRWLFELSPDPDGADWPAGAAGDQPLHRA
jgi:hypothetical protein